MGILVRFSLAYVAHAAILHRLRSPLYSRHDLCVEAPLSYSFTIFLPLYPRGSFVLSCTITFHVDYLPIFGLKLASFGLVFKPLFFSLDLSVKSTLQSFSLYNLTPIYPWKEHSFECHWLLSSPCIEHRHVPLPGTRTYVLWHSFFPLNYSHSFIPFRAF